MLINRVLISLFFCTISCLVDGQAELLKSDSLNERLTVLKEVIVKSKKLDELGNSFMLSKKQLNAIPTLFGEKDYVRALTLLPGIKTESEASSSFHVRGGGYDQNLFLIDNIPVFGSNHLLGLVSTFNPEMIESVEILKNGFPSEYGGRLSSILNVRQKIDLDSTKFTAGLGIIFGKTYLNKVIIPKRFSVMAAMRRSFIDLILPQNKGRWANPLANFFDGNVKSTYQLNKNNQFNLILYSSRDAIYTPLIDTTDKNLDHYKVVNSTLSIGLNWLKTLQNHSLEFVVYNSTLKTNYQYFVTNSSEIQKTYFTNGISELGFKATDYVKIFNRPALVGLNLVHYQMNPGSFQINDFGSDSTISNQYSKIYAQVLSGYYSSSLKFRTNMVVDLGLRVNYAIIKNANNLNLEPRIKVLHEISPDLQFRYSYTLMNQYLHLLVNQGTGISLDTWIPSTKAFPNEKAQQISIGMDLNFWKNNYFLSMDLYHKRFQDIIYYKDGYNQQDVYSEYFVRNGYESIISKGNGFANGFELLFQKKKGKFTGWLSYDLSWVKYQFADLNNGESFYPRFDHRHSVSFVNSIKLNRKWTFNFTWVYQSGQPFPFPNQLFGIPEFDFRTGSFDFNKTPSLGINQGTRDSYRTRDFHRLNLSFVLETYKKRLLRTWEFGVYNAYNRHNPYIYFYQNYKGKFNVVSFSIFPIIPSISYRISF